VYSQRKAKERGAKQMNLEKRLKECKNKCDEYPTADNLSNLEILQAEYDRHYEYIPQGTIIKSRVNWYEQGQKSNKYFLTLEMTKRKRVA